MNDFIIQFLSRVQQNSEYDWANIYFKDCCVGKARCLINGDEFTIFSINIYPEYQGKGYGKEFIDQSKQQYKKLIADRVRSKAIGFWETLGFVQDGNTDNWIYHSID